MNCSHAFSPPPPQVTKLDDLSPIIFLNRTKAALNCAAGFMQVELKFNEPFYGKAYADYDRNSACQTSGKGDLSYRIDLPLKGCGTKQVSSIEGEKKKRLRLIDCDF